MPPRDLGLVASVLHEPFTGYARRPTWGVSPDVDRIAACVALLSAMVLSGIVLGGVQGSGASRH